MQNSKLIYTLLIALVGIAGCKKNELDPAFKAASGIVIGGDAAEGATSGALVYSFAIAPSSRTKDTVSLVVQVMGNIAGYDRQFKIEIDSAATTALPEEYEFPAEVTMPAGQFRIALPLVLNRVARLKDSAIVLAMKVAPTSDFKVGPGLGSIDILGPAFTVSWTDVLTKPVNWDAATGMIYYLGKWSRVKHRLAIDATGYTEFIGLPVYQQYNVASITLQYLNNLNAASGTPLMNENGEVIKICNQCP